jgi:hypothetical protein
LILDVADVSASGGDRQHLLPTIQRVEAHTDVIVERAMGDGAYGSGENLAACANYPTHPIDLVAPHARPDDLQVHKSAFQIDLAAKTATCPEGHTVVGTLARSHGRSGLQFRFARTTCEACPRFARCVHGKVSGRTVTTDD